MMSAPPQAKVPFWRSPEGRAWFFQLIMLAAFIWLAVTVYGNTLENLETRGIGSGFGFLKAEAGFKIGEVTGIPLPRGGFLYFLISLAAGLGICGMMAKRLKKGGDPISTTGLAVCLVAGVGLPLFTLYFFRESVEISRYTASSSYISALATGLANTLKVTVIGCVASSILGLLVALGRLSPNGLMRTLCRWYVELNRNLPLLLQLFFWYFIVLQQLPSVRNSIDVGGWLFLNKRGLFLPALVPEQGAWVFCGALVAGLCGTWLLFKRSAALRDDTGRPGRWVLTGLGLVIGLPALAWMAAGTPFFPGHTRAQRIQF